MCFHAATPKKEDLKKILPAEVQVLDYQPMYHTNGYSHADLPVMTSADPHLVQPMMWGLVPHWTRSAAEANDVRNKTLNARAETLFTTPMYRNYAPHNRCLIFVQGFYEWKHVGKNKIPFFIYMPDREPFALGGIYSHWENKDWSRPYGCSIVTTEADTLMAEIHNTKKRMPLILPESKWSSWLDTSLHPDQVAEVMQPYDEGKLQAHTIGSILTMPEELRNSPAAQERFEYPPTDLF